MAIYELKLLKKEVVAKDTMAFHWQRPEGFEFKAGQFGDFILINPPETDEKGNIRAFSLVNAPFEQDLVTATRMRDSAYKRTLQTLPEGAVVKFDGPHGHFNLHKTETTPAVFIIGGIGVTPVRSMIAQAAHDGLPHNITLLYSNKTLKDAPFMADFKDLANKNPHFTFVPVMTEAEPGEWDGETGFINEELLKRHVTDIGAPIYYLSGPGSMVKDMYKMLVDAGANEDNIRTEEFPGY